MYNETDLKKIWYAYKGGIKKTQVAELMGIPEEESNKMLEEAQVKFGGVRKQKYPSERKVYFRHRAIGDDRNQPLVRPAAKYDNKSSEERINEYLNLDI